MDTTNPNVNPNVMMPQPPKKSAVGPVIGLIIILIIIVIGSLYFWGKRVDTRLQNTATPVETTEYEVVTDDPQAQELQVQSSTDDLNSIEADLNATDFGSIDAGVEELQ